jgi:hypothetical protein
MTSPEQFHHPSHNAAAEARLPHLGAQPIGHLPAQLSLSQTENKLEYIIKQDPHHQRMGEVYRELEGLRLKDQPHFSKNLTAINNKLHQDGLLPDLTIIQDRYSGADRQEHVGYSLVANGRHNPGHRVGSEVSTNHPRVAQTPTSRRYYRSLNRGGPSGYNPARDSAEGGPAADGGYDSHLDGHLLPAGQRKDLIDKALQLAGVPVNAATEAAMNKIITRESHWDPNIVNRSDSNARRGDPSKGLMQVIHSTFEANRDHSLPDSQTDPLANMVAALNYMGVRYGHGDKGAGLLRVAARNSGY